MKTSGIRNRSASRGFPRSAVLSVAVAAFLLASCFSPIQGEQGAAVSISLDFLGTLDLPDSALGWVVDVQLFRAGDLAVVQDGDDYRAQPRPAAEPIPLAGEDYFRIVFGNSPDDVSLSPGGATRVTTRIPSIPAGGPYILYAKVWDGIGDTPLAEYFTGSWTAGAPPILAYNDFFVAGGVTTRIAPSSFTSVVGPALVVNVSIDLSNPTQPVVDFGGAVPQLNRTVNQTMTVNATAGFDSYQWRINGNLSYPSGDAFNNDLPGITVQSQAGTNLLLGPHTVSLIVTQAGVPYSAQFSVSIVEN